MFLNLVKKKHVLFCFYFAFTLAMRLFASYLFIQYILYSLCTVYMASIFSFKTQNSQFKLVVKPRSGALRDFVFLILNFLCKSVTMLSIVVEFPKFLIIQEWTWSPVESGLGRQRWRQAEPYRHTRDRQHTQSLAVHRKSTDTLGQNISAQLFIRYIYICYVKHKSSVYYPWKMMGWFTRRTSRPLS